MAANMPTLSVLVPVYFNEQNLPTTLPALQQVAAGLPAGMDCEIICVDDGSGDGSWSVLREAARHDPRIKAVRLSRNFGAYMALLAGLDVARGDCVAVIMADLQDPPELLLQMVASWRNGNKIVIASREQRRHLTPEDIMRRPSKPGEFQPQPGLLERARRLVTG